MAKRELTHPQKVVATATLLIILTVAITNVVLSSISYAILDVNEDSFHDLLNNWSQGPILDIQVATTCPTGYVPAIDKEWPGTNEDCWCGDISSANRESFSVTCENFCSGTCSSSQLQAGCVNAPGRSAQSLNNWAVIGNQPVQICLRRSSTENWARNGLISGGTCPDGYTTCGTNDDIKYCTQESVCPIIGVGAVSNNQTLNTICANFGEQASCAILENNTATNSVKSLVWFRYDNPPPTGPGLPLSQFRLNEYGMCLNSMQDNITPGREQYFPLSEKTTSCETAGDFLWKRADGTSETYLFFINGLTSYISSLNQFPNPGMSGYYETGASGNDYLYYLFQQSYVPWKAEYRNDMKTLLDNSDIVERITHAQLGWMIMSAISFVLLGIVFPVLIAFYLAGHNFGRKLNKIGKGFIYLLLFLEIPFLLWSLILVAATKHFFHKVSTNEVSLPYVNETLGEFPGNFDYALGATVASLALTIIAMIVLAVLDCYAKRAKRDARAASRGRYDTEANVNNGQLEMKASPQTVASNEARQNP